MANKRRLLRIGVTGGIGSGKSEVCRIFEQLGIPVLSADTIAKEISNYDPRAKQLLVGLLGSQTYTADGALDRTYVASKVFTNKAIQKKVNAIIHPRVEEEVERRFSEMEKKGARMGIVEAALIYEAGLDRVLDAVVVVDASRETRVDRVVKRDGTTASDVEKRMNAQLHPKTKLKNADYVIHNDGTVNGLEQKVRFLYSVFQHLSVSTS